MTEVKDILAPFLKLVENGTCSDCDAVALVRTKYHILLNYCVNVSFFLMLKAKGLPVKMHPVTKRLIQYHKLLDQLQSQQGNLFKQVEEIVNAVKDGKPLYYISDNSRIQIQKDIPKQSFKKITHKKETIIEQDEQEQLLSDNMEETDLDEKESYDDKVIDDEKDNITNIDPTKAEEEKRAITYQMAKNRGLTPYRKKELRNPRVKHKNKYRKALIRRKGAVCIYIYLCMCMCKKHKNYKFIINIRI